MYGFSFQVRITGCIAKNLYTYASNSNPNWKNKCRQQFDANFGGNEFTKAGKKGEILAGDILVEKYGIGKVLTKPGFVACLKFPWLGVSPDIIVVENEEYVLMECKTLKLGLDFEGEDFLNRCKFLTKTPSGYQLKKRGKHFYCQIQLGLFVCNLNRAKLVLYNQKAKCNYYIDVHFDIHYVNDLLHSLANTYFNHCLPYFYDNENNKENEVHTQ